jgi:hypothetical protein
MYKVKSTLATKLIVKVQLDISKDHGIANLTITFQNMQ